MKISNPRLKKTIAFIKEYRHLIYMYIIYAVALTIIFSHNGCTPHFEAVRKGNTVVIKKKKVRVWTSTNCYYCDKAKEFFNNNSIEYTERSINCKMCSKELFQLAEKLKFDINQIDGVPVIVIDEDKIIVGYSPQEFSCLLLKKDCKRVYNKYLDAVHIKK